MSGLDERIAHRSALLTRRWLLGLVAATLLAVGPSAVRSPPAAASPPRASLDAPSGWAFVLEPVTARAKPGLTAARVARLKTRTPERTSELVLAVGRTVIRQGRMWIRVRLPILPNNSTGWVPREALGVLHAVDTHLVVDRGRLTATLYRRGRMILRTPVGVGRDAWPTPAGEFYVRSELRGFDDPSYGPIAFGTSARSPVLTDWPGGGFIGIHGTDAPELLPGRVSHGCVRIENHTIRRLARLLPVGTPLTIR